MRNKSLLFVILSCLFVFSYASIVSAQLPNFIPNFDRKIYELGSPGTVFFYVQTFDVAFDISRVGVTLYLPKTDGTTFETEFFGEDYGETPLQLPANNQSTLAFNFRIPERTDLESGNFFYLFEIYIRQQNTTTYSRVTYGENDTAVAATFYGEPCLILNLESLPSPDPTTEPTPTPVPTNTTPTPTPAPTPKPTENDQPSDTIALTTTEIALIAAIVIAVVFGIIAVWALKRK